MCLFCDAVAAATAVKCLGTCARCWTRTKDLLLNWQNILTVAQDTYDAYKLLTEKRAELKALSG
jgi:hypothetical protein